jgi:predicted oxidoreductase
LESIKKQGKQNDLNDFLNEEKAQAAHKSKSRDKIAEQYALSKDTVSRYVWLAKLPKEFLNIVDDGKQLKFIPAIEISWLSKSELGIIKNCLKKMMLRFL